VSQRFQAPCHGRTAEKTALASGASRIGYACLDELLRRGSGSACKPAADAPWALARLSLCSGRMSSTAKKTKSMISAKSVKSLGKAAARTNGTALAVAANGVRRGRRATRQVGTALQRLSGRTRRLVKSKPVRVLLGAAAIGFVIAKLRHLV
jgi:hypothetical protein